MKMKQIAVSLALTAVSCSSITNQASLQNYVDRNTPIFIQQQKEIYYNSFKDEKKMPILEYGSLQENHIGECDFTTIIFDADKILASGKGRGTKPNKRSISRVLENALQHELSHFHNGKFRDELGLSWDAKIPERIVEEGIAEFIGNTLTNDKSRKCIGFKDLTPGNYEANNYDLTYTVGYCVTGPVIEKYQSRGIKYMLANLPTDEEMKNPYTFRARMLKDLAEGKDMKEETPNRITPLP